MGRRILFLLAVALAIPACHGGSNNDDDDVPPSGPPPSINRPPTVRLLTPVDHTILQNGVPVDLTATASDPDGSVVQVAFFEGSTLLSTVVGPPFQFSWIPVLDGTFSLAAVATDSSGATVPSDPVSVVVETPGTSPGPSPPNQPPLVRITNPVDGTVLSQGSSLTLAAEASDPDGPSLRVEYFDGDTLIGSATLIPFLVNWSGATAGPHSIRAVASDAFGASTSSAPVSIFVTSPSTKQ